MLDTSAAAPEVVDPFMTAMEACSEASVGSEKSWCTRFGMTVEFVGRNID